MGHRTMVVEEKGTEIPSSMVPDRKGQDMVRRTLLKAREKPFRLIKVDKIMPQVPQCMHTSQRCSAMSVELLAGTTCMILRPASFPKTSMRRNRSGRENRWPRGRRHPLVPELLKSLLCLLRNRGVRASGRWVLANGASPHKIVLRRSQNLNYVLVRVYVACWRGRLGVVMPPLHVNGDARRHGCRLATSVDV